MAAISWAYDIAVIGTTPTGDYICEAKCTISDPALSPAIIGTGVMSVVATLPGNTPATWATDLENAIIAAAAALSPSVTVSAARVIMPTFS